MGTYTPRKLPSVLTKQWLDDEFAAVQTAHNTHDPWDFPEKCVPLRALANQYGVFCVVLQHPSAITSAVTNMYYMVPEPCTIIRYSAAYAAIVAVNPKFSIDYDSPVGLVTLHSVIENFDASAYGTLAQDLLPGTLVRVCVNASSGSISGVTATLWFKSKHTV